MSERRSREAMKASFVDRIRSDQQRAERGGGGRFFKSNLPSEVKFWKNSNGQHQIDIIPYCAGPNDPLVVSRDIEEGSEQYVLEFFTHNAVGVGEGGIMCLSKTYGKPCPICEDHKKKTAEGYDDKILWKLRPKKYPRSVYNIIDVDDEKAGCQIWHTSHYLMQMYLLELAKIPTRPGQVGIIPVVDFPSVTDGKTIAFKTETKKTEKGDDMTTCVAHRFVDRPVGFSIPQNILDDAWTLDDLLWIPTYEDVEEFYYGKGSKQEETRGTRDRGAEKEQQEERGRGRGDIADTNRSSRSVPQEDTVRGRRGSEDTLKNEEQQSPSEEKQNSNPCPHGYKFGIDVDKHPDECEKCNEWRACARENRRVQEPAPAEEAKTGPADRTSEETTGRRSRRGAEQETSLTTESRRSRRAV